MSPRVPVSAERNAVGALRPSVSAPSILPARRAFRTAAMSSPGVDPVTSEVVRIRNARYQQCFL